jgi:hypothetical protein
MHADSAHGDVLLKRSVQETPTTHEKGSPPFVLTAYPILEHGTLVRTGAHCTNGPGVDACPPVLATPSCANQDPTCA